MAHGVHVTSLRLNVCIRDGDSVWRAARFLFPSSLGDLAAWGPPGPQVRYAHLCAALFNSPRTCSVWPQQHEAHRDALGDTC